MILKIAIGENFKITKKLWICALWFHCLAQFFLKLLAQPEVVR